MVGIYKIVNKKNNKVYIGQSVNIKQRWALHKSELRNKYHENVYLQNAWNKYGKDNFIFEPITLVQKKRVSEETTVERSMIHPQYANRFIRQYLIDEK